MRVFEPEVYARLRSAKSMVAGITSLTMSSDRRAAERKTAIDAIINAAPEQRREGVKELLTFLFPRLQSVYSNTFYNEDSAQEWSHDARVPNLSEPP